ncbi:MAG TPA: energy-coupling factor ABC transporter permease, partial [Phycisphaerae bacterium]|nr:energy-coupling factor ABC transporter permease [Phycisphaerae bacterium]
MHLPDGVVSAPICVGGFLGAAAATGFALRRVPERQIPQFAVLAAFYFALGAVHLPIGVLSVHLQLTGLLAVLLGWRAIVPVAVGVALQAVLLHHGGVTTLGVNILVLGLPAMAVGAVAAPRLARWTPPVAGLAAGGATVLCGLASLAMAAGLVMGSQAALG